MTQQKHNDLALKHDAGKPGYELLDWGVFLDWSVKPTNPHYWVWDILASWGGKKPAKLIDVLSCAAVLLCPIAPESAMRDQAARVLAFGAEKYGAHNWRKGMRWSRLLGAAMRHLAAFERGEILDPETGLHHLGHFGCCIMFLIVYERDELGEDDRR